MEKGTLVCHTVVDLFLIVISHVVCYYHCQVTRAVHAKGSFIFCQLWGLGRTAKPEVLERTGHDVVSASSIPLGPTEPIPRSLTVEEVRAYVKKYTQAARNAVQAGFDGVSYRSPMSCF